MDDVKQNPMYSFLIVLTVSCILGLQTWQTLINNFAVEAAHLDGSHIGAIQSVREIPGFLSFLVIFVLYVIKEHRLSSLSIIVLGVGMMAIGLLPSFYGLLLTTLATSIGFHYFDTTSRSLTLQYFDPKISPWVFGKIRSYSAAASIATGLLIYLIAPIMNYTQIYILMGVLILAAGIWGYMKDPTHTDTIPQHRRIIFKKKYWLFYFLTFMGGARRQIFVAFAAFLLVQRHQFSLQTITLLFALNNVINFFFSPIVGKAIIRFGERKILTLEYFGLTIIFLSYTSTDSRVLLTILYILDHLFFNFSMGSLTYFQKVTDPKDIAPSMAAGNTINHIAAVFLPFIGGLLWMVDYRIPFLIGAGLSLVSLIIVQMMRTG
jgi:predicted MFS family arabinose efflux permease